MPEAPLDIIPRDLRFGLVENADPAWFEGDVLLSAIMDGFAVSLPEGERFFVPRPVLWTRGCTMRRA
jgi:predicted metal-dependent hydrolase